MEIRLFSVLLSSIPCLSVFPISVLAHTADLIEDGSVNVFNMVVMKRLLVGQ